MEPSEPLFTKNVEHWCPNKTTTEHIMMSEATRPSNSALLFLAASLLVMPVLMSQTPGPGLRLFTPTSSNDTHLVDTNGNTVHTWLGSYRPGVSVYLLDDGSLLRTIRTVTGPSIGGAGGGIQKVAFDGSILWDFRYDSGGLLTHHDIEPLPNGNVLMIAWETKSLAEAINEGRNPLTISSSVMLPDHIIEVQPTGPTSGSIVWEWHAWDHVIQDYNPAKANYGVVGDHPELLDINAGGHIQASGDWTHINAIDYDSVNDWILLSSPRCNEIYVIDHSTTTAQAAGHTGGIRGKGGDLLYRWGNPAAYDAGGLSDQQLHFQHSAGFIPSGYPGAGNILLFNNQMGTTNLHYSEVWELVPPLDANNNFIMGPNGTYGPTAPIWTYGTSGFYSSKMSSAERMPNGNTLVCSSTQSWLFEVLPSGQQVWQYFTGTNSRAFHVHYVETSLWSDHRTVSVVAGGSVKLDLVHGSRQSGAAYYVLASASGTSPGISVHGHTLPLNPDDLFTWTVNNPNSPPILTQTVGTLDAVGRANATINIPSGLPASMVGYQFHLAVAVLNLSTVLVTDTSNAVPVTIVP